MTWTVCIREQTYEDWISQHLSNQIRYEVDQEVFKNVCELMGVNPYVYTPPQDWQVWLPEEIACWCYRMEIYPHIQDKGDRLVLTFDCLDHLTNFKITWL